MRPSRRVVRQAFLALLALGVFPGAGRGQQNSAAPRITTVIDEGNRVVLAGNRHPLARAEYDRGIAPGKLPLERMLLVLRRSPEQQAVLDRLLADQHNPGSPNYHQWLTPRQFGEQFGPADEDVQAVAAWLGSHGFLVTRVANGRVVIEFSGTAGQLQETFRTEVHKYAVNGVEHWANAGNPEIPAALAPVVAGVATLHNFRKAPQLVHSGETVRAVYRPGAQPQLTFPDGKHALAPQDFATIYGANGAYSSGINGSGISIAIVGRSNLNTYDLADFRSVFGLAGPEPQVYLDGPDPGDIGGDDEVEAVLDTSWAGAVATNATVTLVVSASTNTTDGVDLSELYIIENDSAEIMTESYGTCEVGVTSAEAAAKSALAEQAAAEGITYFVSSGDSGAEGCDDPHSETVATGPLSVNLLASSPYVVAVGGTEFNEGSGNYWNPSTTSLETAVSYIPEDVWNDSCTSSNCPSGSSPNIVAGGGGSSILYPKPPWQTGVTGIPMDGARDLPDVSLTASGHHDPYLICLRLSCNPNAQGQIELFLVGGTSVSAPSFASIMALVDQKAGGRQGQSNYVFYSLAARETLSQCNGSSQTGLPGSTCIFNDVAVGNNSVPGESGYGTPTTNYQSGVGYDLATGLGSVNVNNLLNSWASARSTASMVSPFMLNPTTNIQHGTTPVSFSATVAPQTGTGTPSGDVTLMAEGGIGGVPTPVAFATLSNGSAFGSTQLLPGGTYNVVMHYAGDGTYLPSDSAPVQVTVTPESSSIVISAFQGTVANPTPFTSGSYGVPFSLLATVSGQSGNGVPTFDVCFYLDGNPVFTPCPSLSVAGQAVFPGGSVFPAPGQHSITARYFGDASFSPSNSAPLAITISPAATGISVQSNMPGTVAGQPITLTATVTAGGNGTAPSGTVTFFSGSTQLGTAPLSNVQNNSGSFTGTATLTTNQLPSGMDSITAQYGGDTNYTGSNSAPVQVTVSGTFLITASPAVIAVPSPGQSGSTTLTFVAATGFTGSATLSAAACSNLPPESSCSFTPSTFSFTQTTTSVPVMLTINTTAPGKAGSPARRLPPGMRTMAPELALICAAGLSLLLWRARRPRWRASLAGLAFGAIALCASCGGGGGSSVGGGGGGGGSNPGTTPGNYPNVSVTVTINGATQTLNNLLVVVQF